MSIRFRTVPGLILATALAAPVPSANAEEPQAQASAQSDEASGNSETARFEVRAVQNSNTAAKNGPGVTGYVRGRPPLNSGDAVIEIEAEGGVVGSAPIARAGFSVEGPIGDATPDGDGLRLKVSLVDGGAGPNGFRMKGGTGELSYGNEDSGVHVSIVPIQWIYRQIDGEDIGGFANSFSIGGTHSFDDVIRLRGEVEATLVWNPKPGTEKMFTNYSGLGQLISGTLSAEIPLGEVAYVRGELRADRFRAHRKVERFDYGADDVGTTHREDKSTSVTATVGLGARF